MADEFWRPIHGFLLRVFIAGLTWPADYMFTGPILGAACGAFFFLKRRKHRHPERVAIVLWFGLMTLWWVLRFNTVLYPIKLDGGGFPQ